MNVRSKIAVMATLLSTAAAMPASAQNWKWDWNVNGGWAGSSKVLSADNFGFTGDNTSDAKFGSGGIVGTQLGYWMGNFGLRLNGAYSDGDMTSSDFNVITPAGSGLDHINLWSASLDLMWRFTHPRDNFTGFEAHPYLALGGGVKWHNPAGDNYTCTDVGAGKSWACAPFTFAPILTTNPPQTGRNFELAEANTFMGLGALGADWRVSRGFAIRTEIGDRFYKPQIAELAATPAVVVGPNTTTFLLGPNGDERVSKTVNEIYATIGLNFLFGIKSPPAVAVVAPPAPPPPPPPAPSREDLSVCVVDPTADNGLRMQPAVLVAGRDTVVVVGGEDRPFSSAVGNVPTAANADWFVRGQPLTITLTNGKIEYATYGSTRVISSSDLAFVGTINGLPAYADRNDVSGFINELNQVNSQNPGQDLGTVLSNQKTLAQAFGNVKVLYVPTQASGCVFQAVQRQEEVRKGK